MTPGAELQRLDVQGRSLAYRVEGAGPVLVLVHAFPLDQRMWAPQRALAAHCRLVTYDVRGLGASELGTAPYSLDDLADDLDALVSALGVERFVLGGLSMGGYIALAYQRRHGERLRGLLLADTRAGADTPAARERRLAIAERLSEPAPPPNAELVAPGPLVAPDAAPALLAQLTAWINEASPRAVAGAARAMAGRPDSTPGLGAIAVPALVVVGEKDGLTPPAEAELLAGGLPNSELVRLAGVGHLSNLEAPEAFNGAVAAWLERLPR